MVLALLLAATPSPAVASERAVVVDRIVAVVGERLVLQSDIELERVLAPLETSPVRPLFGSDPDPLQVAIDRAIIRGLAGNAAIYVPSEADVQSRVASIRGHFAEERAWTEFQALHGLDDDRLASLLYSRVVVDRYIVRNLTQGGSQPSATTYAEWMAHQRARVPIRMVPVISSGAGAP